MKFEEAKKDILMGTYPCYSECLDDENCEIHGSTSYIHVMGVIDKLKETYAPRIKMTHIEHKWFRESCEKYDDLEMIIISKYFDFEKTKKISAEAITLAWLHPELIEVEK